jgi:hypothetical protein
MPSGATARGMRAGSAGRIDPFSEDRGYPLMGLAKFAEDKAGGGIAAGAAFAVKAKIATATVVVSLIVANFIAAVTKEYCRKREEKVRGKTVI